MIRIGHGFDVHKFGGQGPIIIGGVTIDYSLGLVAHSDGDVLIHAICDALLGAMALGDIGHHFPDTEQDYAGIDSRELLRHCMKLVAQHGYVLGNLDATIVAQAPKMAPHIDAMRQHLANDLNASLNQVNVKASTSESLGYVGRKEGIAAHAVVLLQR